MLGLSHEAGGFVRGETISIVNRLEDTDSRDQFRWAPDAPVARDLRLFALLAGAGEDALPEASLRWTDSCADDLCAVLEIEGEVVLSLSFEDDGDRFELVALSDE